MVQKFLILFYKTCMKTPDTDSNNVSTVDLKCSIDNDAPQPFNQSAHSDLIRYLGLSKKSAEILSLILKGKSSQDICYFIYNEKTEFITYFLLDSIYVYCKDISRLVSKFVLIHKA